MAETRGNEQITMDLSDVDHRVGKLVGGGQLHEPCAKSDIRRWVMAMDYVNPLHWNQEFAGQSKFGDIIAPQSMALPRLPRAIAPAGGG
jgi:acyl dehydratase